MFKTVRMGYEFIGFPCMDSYAVCLKIQTDLVKLNGMGLFFQNRLGQSAGLGNPAALDLAILQTKAGDGLPRLIPNPVSWA
jgi:galactokinase